jgi:hypothetical protein
MPIRKPELITRRNAAIVKDYRALYKQGYRLEVCCEKLSEKYYLASGTIYNIIYAAQTALSQAAPCTPSTVAA